MNNDNSFSYAYSAKDNQEVLNIRKKYLPREESKLQELKRLDSTVQNSRVIEALSVGVGSCLIFGVGLCLVMKAIGGMFWLGLVLGLVGIGGMIAAFPVYRKLFQKAKAEHTPRILELTEELTGNN